MTSTGPSDHWKSSLVLLIQECLAETDQDFESFVDELVDAVFDVYDEVTDFNLVKYIKDKL